MLDCLLFKFFCHCVVSIIQSDNDGFMVCLSFSDDQHTSITFLNVYIAEEGSMSRNYPFFRPPLCFYRLIKFLDRRLGLFNTGFLQYFICLIASLFCNLELVFLFEKIGLIALESFLLLLINFLLLFKDLIFLNLVLETCK